MYFLLTSPPQVFFRQFRGFLNARGLKKMGFQAINLPPQKRAMYMQNELNSECICMYIYVSNAVFCVIILHYLIIWPKNRKHRGTLKITLFV